MLARCARGTKLDPEDIERDYWMFQIARMLQADSSRHPGSPACMSGGSMLALVGITERLSEDADFNVAFPGGLAACSNQQGKNLLDEYQKRAASGLGVSAQRRGSGGGNLFRTVDYHYPSAVPGVANAAVESDMGIRDIDPKYILTLPGRPYLARRPGTTGPQIGSADIRCMHPITTLVDKLDAVCWREAADDPTEPAAAAQDIEWGIDGVLDGAWLLRARNAPPLFLPLNPNRQLRVPPPPNRERQSPNGV